MSILKDIGISIEEAAEALRILGRAGTTSTQAVRELSEAMALLATAAKREEKNDFIKINKKIIKPPKHRLIRDD